MIKMNRLTVRGLVLVSALTLLPFDVRAQRGQEKDALAYRQAYNLVLEEKWDEALKAMEDLVKNYAKSTWADDARFWQCQAREKLGQSGEEVFKCYQEFIAAFAESELTDDARSNMVRLGRGLVKAGKPEYEAIIQTLEEDQRADVRLAALYALRDIGEKESLQTIIDLMIRLRTPPQKPDCFHAPGL
jgi:HEAT repeat protein